MKFYSEYIRQLHKKRKIANCLKWVEDAKRNFTEDTAIANNYMKKYSTSLAIREMQIKVTMT